MMKERRSPLKIFLFESSSSSSVANPKFYECLPASESNKPPQVELLVQLLLNFVVATVLFQLVPQSPKGGPPTLSTLLSVFFQREAPLLPSIAPFVRSWSPVSKIFHFVSVFDRKSSSSLSPLLSPFPHM